MCAWKRLASVSLYGSSIAWHMPQIDPNTNVNICAFATYSNNQAENICRSLWSLPISLSLFLLPSLSVNCCDSFRFSFYRFVGNWHHIKQRQKSQISYAIFEGTKKSYLYLYSFSLSLPSSMYLFLPFSHRLYLFFSLCIGSNGENDSN